MNIRPIDVEKHKAVAEELHTITKAWNNITELFNGEVFEELQWLKLKALGKGLGSAVVSMKDRWWRDGHDSDLCPYRDISVVSWVADFDETGKSICAEERPVKEI